MYTPAPSPHATAPASRRGPRDPWRDNARALLMVLVVFGHCLEPLKHEAASFGDLYRFIYLFHMPAFAFLSGSVARADVNLRLLRNILFGLLVPYLLFQCLYALASHAPGWPGHGPGGPTRPYWLLWYLVSLAGWRLLLPLFAHLRQPLLIALGVAIAAGFASDIGYGLSLSRTLVFFPLFLIGWRHAEQWRSLLAGVPWRIAAVVTLAALLLVASTTAIDPRWLYGSLGYAALHVDGVHGALLRMLQLGANVIGSAAFLALVPRGNLALTRLGPGSLQVFLAHGFLVKLAAGLGLFAWLQASLPPLALGLVLLGLALLCVATLGGERSRRWLSPLTSPQWLQQRAWREPT